MLPDYIAMGSVRIFHKIVGSGFRIHSCLAINQIITGFRSITGNSQ